MTDEEIHGTESPGDESDGTVLEMFGVKLSVKNPRLAELLTMDAKDALTSDIKQLSDPIALKQQKAELQQAMPDVAMRPETERESEEAQARGEFRGRVDALGRAMDFEVGSNGSWTSASGLTLLVRAVREGVSYASASDFVHKIEAYRTSHSGTDDGTLFVTADQRTSDVFKVAIRQAGLYDHIRTISLESLEVVRSLYGAEVLDHVRVVALLLPVADIDVGELLAVFDAERERRSD